MTPSLIVTPFKRAILFAVRDRVEPGGGDTAELPPLQLNFARHVISKAVIGGFKSRHWAGM